MVQSPFNRWGRWSASGSGGGNPLAAYAAGGITPVYVLDFTTGNYFVDGASASKSTAVNFSRSSAAWGFDADTGLLTEYGVNVQRTNNKIWSNTGWVTGVRHEREARTNLIANSDVMTGWTGTNVTATKDQTGADGNANAAHRLTASADGGTMLLTVTAATANYVFGALVKRITGTGTVEVTVDGGTTWVDVTETVADEWRPVSTGAGLSTTNPQVGYRLGTSGDEIAVQVNQLEATAKYLSSPIPTTGTARQRNLELMYASAAVAPWGDAITVQMVGGMDYVDDGTTFYNLSWGPAGVTEAAIKFTTGSTQIGSPQALQRISGAINGITALTDHYSPGQGVRYAQAAVFSTTRHQFAAEENLAIEDATGAQPNLAAIDPYFGTDIMGWFERIVIFEADVGDAGLVSATQGIPVPVEQTSAYFIGDSTVKDYLGGAALNTLIDSARTEVMVAIPNDTIADQKADWQALTKRAKNIGWVTVQVGLNDLDPAEDAPTAIARLQDLVDTIRADCGQYSKILICGLTPCRSRLITIYGATNGPIAYQKWLDMNEAIAGGGSNPITGVDGRVTSHVAAMGDGSDNLHPDYDTGDGIHPNTAGRTINAAAYETAIAALGITV